MGITSWVDHVNKDALDNRRRNLRGCTSSQNRANQNVIKSNTSGFMGVIADRRGKRIIWRAQLQVNGKHISLGGYEDPVLAAKAYDKAKLEYFNEFATTNAMLGLYPEQKEGVHEG